MKTFLLLPFKLALREMETNKQIKEELLQSNLKIKGMYGFVYMNYMAFVMYIMLYIEILYFIVGIIITPLAIIGVAIMILFTWGVTSVHKNVYPKTRENYLKSIGYYQNK